MTKEVATSKPRAPRAPLTEFGRKLKGFVSAVDPHKLNIRVANILGDNEVDKVGNSISGMIRRAGQENGVISIRSKELVEAVFKAVTELDPDQEVIANRLMGQFHFQPISSANREPGQNWLVRLKSGEPIVMKDGPEGHGLYKLEYVGPAPEGDEE